MRLTCPLVEMTQVSSNSKLETTLELDLHANTTVLGAGALIVQNYNQNYNRPVEVVGYDPSHGSLTYDAVSNVLALITPPMVMYITWSLTRQSVCPTLTITCFAQCNAV
jgi:hypothetical protein